VDAQAQLLKGVLPVATLAVLAAGDSYGYRVLQELRARGLESVGDASVYGTLQKLFDDGLLDSYVAESENGPARRYYSLTDAGATALVDGRSTWRGFVGVIDGLLDSAGRVDADV
jgi:PadR family transcriptional regulator PadR